VPTLVGGSADLAPSNNTYLPGLGDFVGEFLILLGTSSVSLGLTVAATIGVLAATFYALRMVQRAFHGPNRFGWSLPDLVRREVLIIAPMIIVLLWLGLYPQPIFNTFQPAMIRLQQHAGWSGQTVWRVR
jgi:NADH-quinone oxidoreductase subunit M